MGMAQKYYAATIKDWTGTENWVCDVIRNGRGVFFRSDDAFAMVEVDVPFFEFEPEATVRLFAGNALQVARLMLYIKQWGKSVAIKEFRFQSTTGVDVRKLAKLVGAREDSPTFVMETGYV